MKKFRHKITGIQYGQVIPDLFRIPVYIFMLLLCSCGVPEVREGTPGAANVDIDSIPDAVPKVEPRSRYGNPGSYKVFGKRYYVINNSRGYVERGIASWYGNDFHGRRTSNGETYDMYAMTAAHKSLPLPTYVEVHNLDNSRHVVVRVNDRGPFHENRIIDLSYIAARKLGIVKSGTALVEIRAIDPLKYVQKTQTEKSGAAIHTAADAMNTSGFYIQIGAFSSMINARQLQNRVATLAHNRSRIDAVHVHDKTIYRVQIGPLHSIDVADSIAAKLGDYGISEHHIVLHQAVGRTRN